MGRKDGFIDGVLEGAKVGILLGLTVGLDGCMVGFKLGSTDGATLEARLGAKLVSAAVGSAVGSALGSAVGSAEGMGLCANVGALLGLVVGSAVGSAVGSPSDSILTTNEDVCLNEDTEFDTGLSGSAFELVLAGLMFDAKGCKYHTAKHTMIKPTMVTDHLEVLYIPIPTDNPPQHTRSDACFIRTKRCTYLYAF